MGDVDRGGAGLIDQPSPLSQLFDAVRAGTRVAVAARVEAYRPGPCEADVVLLVQEERLVDGVRVAADPIRVSDVPVLWPAGGGRALTMGLDEGDEVIALVRHRSHDEIDNGEPGPVQPVSTRRMSYSDVVLLPGYVRPADGRDAASYRSDGQPVLSMPGGEALHVGASTATFVLVRADLLDSFLGTLKTWLDTHTHGGVTTGGGITGIPAPLSPSASDLSSDRIKVDS